MPLRTPLFALLLLLCSRAPAQTDGDLYALDHIVDIELEMLDKHWRKKLLQWKSENSDRRTLAHLTVDGTRYDSVGVRFKGNSSYHATAKTERRKLPFNVKVSHVRDGQRVNGKYETLKLSNLFRDPSYVRESLSYAIARDYMPAPRCNYARLTVDGEPLGLYNLSESIDEQFWADHLGSPTGLLFKCDRDSKDPPPAHCPPGIGASLKHLGPDSACYASRYEIKKSDHGWDELIDFTRRFNAAEEPAENYLNVDEALWMLAFDNALVNLDSYLGLFCHNYYLFRDTSGYWRPIVWDLNLSFGGFRLLDTDAVLDDGQLQTLSPFLHFADKHPDRPLITQLLSRPLFRKLYVAHLRTIYDQQFAGDQWQPRAEAIRQTIAAAVAAEPNPLYAAGSFERNYVTSVETRDGSVVGLRELISGRKRFLAEHPLFRQPTPAIAEQTGTRTGDSLRVAVTLGAGGPPAEGVWVAHRPRGRGGFRFTRAEAEADSNYVASWAGAREQEYFIIAEGRVSATVLPARSAREWFTLP